MILDSSALIAVIMAEPGAEQLLAKMREGSPAGIGGPTLVETVMVLSRLLNGDPMGSLGELLEALDVEVIPFTREHSRVAVEAFRRFGKGRHPAGLNFGDCLTYAVASIAGKPLLYVGNDYSQTDLASA